MTERDLQRVLTQSVQDVHLSEEARRAIRLAAKEERPVKMKKFVAIALAVMLMLSATAAVAAELGMFDFLARKMGQTVLPGANELVQMNLASAETEHANYLVSQAAYDGKSASIMIDITPKNEDILLLDETCSPDEDLMAWLKPEMEGSQQTIAEYAAENGMTIIYATVRQEPMDECAVIDDWNNGTLSLLRTFNAEKNPLPLTFTFTTFPYMPDGTYLPSTTTVQFALKAAAPLWQVSHELSIDVPEFNMHIDRITLTGTAIQSYWELHYSISDAADENLFYTFDVLSPNGELLPRGVLGMGGHPNSRTAGEDLVANGGFGAFDEPPAQLMLRVRNTMENIILMETLIDFK